MSFQGKPIRVAFLVVDDRFGNPGPVPFFGTAPSALLQGFEELGREKIEVHVICCTQHRHPAPEKLAENIWYHQLHVPTFGFLRSLHTGCVLAVRKLLKKLQPDVVHSQGTERWCAISGALGGTVCESPYDSWQLATD
jgi:hypothetical protein